MHHARLRRWLEKGLLWLGCVAAVEVQGGGSGLNTVVVLNQNSSNSCEVANYFCERRGVPPENVLRLHWPVGSNAWSSADFQSNLLNPLLNLVASRQLSSQVSFVVLSMDVPFQTVNGSTVNSTTSALFYGLRANDGTGLPVTNSYAGTESSFEANHPAYATNGAFLATLLTANSVAEAKRLVDRGVDSDGTFPAQPVVLAKSSDPARNIRYTEYDNAALNVALLGVSTILRTNTDALWPGTNFLGYQTGLAQFALPSGSFVPGALADSLSSYGGDLFDPANSQTNLLAFLSAGATGSYGTVIEPGADPQKFPNAQVYFYQARGFSLAESYYQSLAAPYLGLVAGEPLAAPFAQTGSGRWLGVSSNAVLRGTVPLAVQFAAHDADRPLAQVDLFVDGQYYRTLTQVGPCPGNLLKVTLNNYPLSYTVPTNATLSSLASELAALFNASNNLSATRVLASAHGDRIELQCAASNYFAAPFYFADEVSTQSLYRATYVTWPLPPCLAGEGEVGGAFRVRVKVPVPMPYTVLASTDLRHWLPIFTNLSGTSLDFLDEAAPGFQSRFYRLVSNVPYDQPKLSAVTAGSRRAFQMHVDSPTLLPYVVQSSSDLRNWAAIFTNSAGGAIDFTDGDAANLSQRFYRVQVLPQTAGAPGCTVVAGASAGGELFRVDGALAPYTIEVATNSGSWVAIFTNAVPGGVQTTASSVSGTGSVRSTFLTASRPSFRNLEVQGYCPYVLLGPLQSNAWVQLNFTKTNGVGVSVAVTNLANLTLAGLAARLCAAINTNAALQGADGVVAEDYVVNGAGTPTFNLRARSPGLEAAGLGVAVKRYGLSCLPSAPITLTNNLGDLRPRNHLYVSAGAALLGPTFTLDTTTLADGFHELIAVAYEGSAVRTQTRVTMPVQITNAVLAATMTLLDLTNTAPVGQTYHIQVAANTSTVSTIRLFSTGGLLAAATNQPTATFAFEGRMLGVGLHPFYALVDTSDGHQYRTATQSVRLTCGP